jgi:uncharacterized membrane protein (UPF0182 family)
VRRTAFALSFGDFNILISGQVKPGSKVLYYRNVQDRLENAAPFLTYDSDPYPVVLNGRLYWVDDAYTTTANFLTPSRQTLLAPLGCPGRANLAMSRSITSAIPLNVSSMRTTAPCGFLSRTRTTP